MTDLSQDSLAQPEQTGRRLIGGRFSSAQILFAVILALGLLLTLNFSSRIQLDHELQAIHRQVLGEIDALLDEQQALADELEYVKSDAYVEFWARDEGKMIREGEVLIFPRGAAPAETPAKTPVKLVDFVTTRAEPTNWELWWALFFDDPPPDFD